MRPLAQVVDLHGQQPLLQALAEDAFGEEAVEHRWEQRQDVNVQGHGGNCFSTGRAGALETKKPRTRVRGKNSGAGAQAAGARRAFLIRAWSVSLGLAPLPSQ